MDNVMPSIYMVIALLSQCNTIQCGGADAHCTVQIPAAKDDPLAYLPYERVARDALLFFDNAKQESAENASKVPVEKRIGAIRWTVRWDRLIGATDSGEVWDLRKDGEAAVLKKDGSALIRSSVDTPYIATGVELDTEIPSRRFIPSGQLSGRIGHEYSDIEVVMEYPSGATVSYDPKTKGQFATGRFQIPVPPAGLRPGRYRVGIYATGPNGPAPCLLVSVGEHEDEIAYKWYVAEDETRSLREIRQSVFEQVNQLRESRSLSALQWDERLAAVGQDHAEDMSNGRFYGHISPNAGTVADRVKRKFGIEGVKWAIPGLSSSDGRFVYDVINNSVSVQECVDTWTHMSPGHRDALLEQSIESCGVGVVFAMRQRGELVRKLLFVAVFGCGIN